MENLIVVSKVKKFIKENGDFNTSSNFFGPLNDDIVKSITEAIAHAQKLGRKTVMGKDFNFFVESAEVKEALVVTSKIKKHIKETAGLSTSTQAIDQLSHRVQTVCLRAIENARKDKRKTVMDRDYQSPIAG